MFGSLRNGDHFGRLFDGLFGPIFQFVKVGGEEKVRKIFVSQIMNGDNTFPARIAGEVMGRRPPNAVVRMGKQVKGQTKTKPTFNWTNLVIVPVISLWRHVSLEWIPVIEMKSVIGVLVP